MLAVILVYALSNMQQSSNFRLRRIQVWLHPEDYASGDGYQTLQALYAIGSGGFFGRGLGNSIQKLGSVPEAQNDMIFSIICEELGIFGAIMVLALFGYLLYRLFFIAQNAPGYVWLPACERCFCTYRFAGYYERSCCAEHHAKHQVSHCHLSAMEVPPFCS